MELHLSNQLLPTSKLQTNEKRAQTEMDQLHQPAPLYLWKENKKTEYS